MKQAIDPASLQGTVERVTFYNPENGFTVVRLRVRGRREPVTVVGSLPAVQPGEALDLTGRWQTDPRHGAQFRVETAVVRPPSVLDDIVRYLGSGLVRQIGPVLARRIVATLGERTLDVLDAQPHRVREVPGIGRQRAQTIAAAWIEHRTLRAVTDFLSEHRLDTRYAPRLVAAYGQDTPKVLKANPYRLVAEVPGLGFAAADRLGQDLGIRPTAAARLQAAVQATLLEVADRGHTRLSREALTDQAAELAGVEPALIDAAIAQLLASGVIAVEDQRPSSMVHGRSSVLDPPQDVRPTPAAKGRLRIYEPVRAEAAPARHPDLGLGLSGLVRAEETLAESFRAFGGRPSRESPAAVDGWLAGDAGAQALSEEQRAAVRTALLSTCFVLTGGPGVGKTTTVRVIVRYFQAAGRSVALAAPTGKAAKRLGEVVGIEAKTIHRLLGAGPQGFHHGRRDPLPFDVVIVDEASMLDTQLARAIVTAVRPGGQLILVGDADQLPSVGPGQVLRDLLASDQVPAARLETVFRQAARSQIVSNAHRIRQGRLPVLAPPTELAQGVDCVFVPAPPDRVAELAADWAATQLPRLTGLPPGEVQVLAPLTRVCQAVNNLLQTRLNPPGGQAERPHGALALRVGDRVIQTRNNYNLGVFNGDTGLVVAIDPAELTVDFGDGRLVSYAPADLLDLDHAYCLTVHRSQGSEWPGVVLLISSSYGPILSRNLLYTALTRARRAAVVIGDQAAIARAVAETRDQNRMTGLAQLLSPESGLPSPESGFAS